MYENFFNPLSPRFMDRNWILIKYWKFAVTGRVPKMVWGFFVVFVLFSCSRHTLTCHQYYLQLRKDILEDRMHCDDETALLLASLALQAEYGDYQAEVRHQFHL